MTSKGGSRAPFLLCNDSGMFPDTKCIISLVLLCLPSEDITTVCHRMEAREKQKVRHGDSGSRLRFRRNEHNVISTCAGPACSFYFLIFFINLRDKRETE